MSRFAQIDLSQLPPPDVVEALDYEVQLDSAITRMAELLPEVEDTLALESEPLRKLIELITYSTLLLRARINDAARATMLATATGSDLDNLAALLGVVRLVLDAGDQSATPPIAATMEADDALRQRTQLALEGYTTAGSVGAYEFHARSADGRVSDVSVISPSPGDVLVTVLSTEGDGTASPELTGIVSDAVNAEEVRPLCDSVSVSAATILHYNVEATLEIAEGPDAGVVEAAAQDAVASYCASVHALGATVAVSGLLRALHQAGVISATLVSPTADIESGATEAPHCGTITITREAV